MGAVTEVRRGNRAGHGWGAYFWPYVSFGVIGQLGTGLPEDWQPLVLPLQVVTPVALMLFYFSRDHYPELRDYPYRLSGATLDFAVGVAGGAMWMAPYLWFDSLRPDADGFDVQQWGEDWVPVVMALRCVGYGIVTPFWEEILIRGWLVRYIDVFDRPTDFRDVPIGRYSARSFWVITVFFTLSHVPWEWPVAVPWIVLSMAWFYYRKNLLSLIILHAGSNLSIFAFVALQSGKWLDGSGQPLDLWFFV